MARARLALALAVVMAVTVGGCAPTEPPSEPPGAKPPAKAVEYGGRSVSLQTGTVRTLFGGDMKIDNVIVEDGKVELVALYLPGNEPDGMPIRLSWKQTGIGGEKAIDIAAFPMQFTLKQAGARLSFQFSTYDPRYGVMMHVRVSQA